MFSVVFEDNFLLLPAKHQQIWKVLWWFCNKHRNAFPSHALIAEKSKCCIRTVCTAIKNFQNFGWIQTLRRCFRSSVYRMHEKLLKVDPKDQRVFMKKPESCEQGGGGVFRGDLQNKLQSIYCSSRNIATVRYTVHQTDTSKQPKRPYIRPHLQKYPFLHEDKVRIQNIFTEAEIALACESYDTYNKPKINPIALFWWLCKKSKEYFKNGKL